MQLADIERKFAKDPNNQFGVVNYGQALRYGKYAVVSVCNFYSTDKSIEKADEIINLILSIWIKFEVYATSQPTNAAYFRIYIDPETEEKQKQLDYTGYYKGRTLDKDLVNFFLKIPYENLQGQQSAADSLR